MSKPEVVATSVRAHTKAAEQITAFLAALEASCGGCRQHTHDSPEAEQNCPKFHLPDMYGQCDLPAHLLRDALSLLTEEKAA